MQGDAARVELAEPWEERLEKGSKAEEIVMAIFKAAGWSVLPFGAARINSPVPRLVTPDGDCRAVDFMAWPPGGATSWSVEVKSKRELSLGGYGLDRDLDAPDPWHELREHHQRGGPVLLVVWDPGKQAAFVASVPLLAANGGPAISANGKIWWWKTDRFMALDQFLAQFINL